MCLQSIQSKICSGEAHIITAARGDFRKFQEETGVNVCGASRAFA